MEPDSRDLFLLDNRCIVIFNPSMQRKAFLSAGRACCRPHVQFLSVSVLLAVCVMFTGCSLSPLAKHATAFSTIACTVIDSSEDAYRAAIKLRQDEQVTAAVYNYDKDPTWNPETDMKPLLTPEQLSARIKVLDGLKSYAASLVELTGKPSDKDTKALDAAAAGAGANLKALKQTVATDLATVIPHAPVMSSAVANGVSAAVLALGEYLIAKRIKGSLPKVTQDMNENVVALCELLDSDIVVLRRQADVDYQQLLQDQDQFIRHQGTALNPIQHRDEVGKLIDIASKEKANDALLAKLQKALHTLALTHQALAAAAQGNNPESIQEQIAGLAAAGSELGAFYKSLPTK